MSDVSDEELERCVTAEMNARAVVSCAGKAGASRLSVEDYRVRKLAQELTNDRSDIGCFWDRNVVLTTVFTDEPEIFGKAPSWRVFGGKWKDHPDANLVVRVGVVQSGLGSRFGSNIYLVQQYSLPTPGETGIWWWYERQGDSVEYVAGLHVVDFSQRSFQERLYAPRLNAVELARIAYLVADFEERI